MNVNDNKGDFALPVKAKFGDAAKGTLKYARISNIEQRAGATATKTWIAVLRSQSTQEAELEMPIEQVIEKIQMAYSQNKIADFSPVELKLL